MYNLQNKEKLKGYLIVGINFSIDDNAERPRI